MPIHGSLDEASLPDVLQLLALGKKTGCLTLTEGSLEGRIFLDNGRVCHATVTSRKNRLEDVLVKQGRITREQLSAAVEQQGRAKRKSVGQVLIESGQIDRKELEKFVRGQVEEAVYFLFTWRTGDFTFSGNVRPKGQDFPVSIDPESLLLEGARRVDEWSEIAKKIPSLELVYRLEKDPRRAKDISLSDVQLRIIPLIDGARDVKGIVEASGLVEFDVGKALYGLITAGFAKLVDRRVRVRHLEYRELLAYLVHEAEFADPEKRKEAGRHILDCPACAASLKKIHVSRTEEFPTADQPATAAEAAEAGAEDDAEVPTVETPRVGLQDRVVMKSASDMLMPAEAADPPTPEVERRHSQRRSGGDRRRVERRRGERRRAASRDWPSDKERRSGGDRRRNVQRRVAEQRRGSDRRVAYAGTDRSTPGGGAAVAAASLAAVPQRSSGRRTDPRRRTTGPRHATEPRQPAATPPAAAAAPPPAAATPDVATPIDPDKTIETPPPAASAPPEASTPAPPQQQVGKRARGPGTGRSSQIEWLVTPDESVEMIRSSRAAPSPVPPVPPTPPEAKTPQPAEAPTPKAPAKPRKKLQETVARSAAAAAPQPAPRPAPAPKPEAQPRVAPQPVPPARQTSGGRWFALAAAVVIVAGLGWGLSTVLGSPGSEVVPPAGPTVRDPDVQPPAPPAGDAGVGVTQSAALAGAALPTEAAAEEPAPEPAAAAPTPQLPAPRPEPIRPAPLLLRGTVVDGQSNRPLGGVQIEIAGTGVSTVSDADGTFRFRDPPVGDLAVVARLGGYGEGEAPVRVDPRSGGQVRLALERTPPPAAPAPQPVAEEAPAEQPPAAARQDNPPAAQPEPQPVAPAPQPAAPEPEPAAARPQPAETDPELMSGDWIRISRAQAAEILGREIVAVPGLPIESVARPGTSTRSGIRIAQTMEGGNRLELVITRPPFLSRARGRPGEDDRISAVRVAAPSTPGGTATGTARLGSYLVTAKAAVSGDRLEALLNRLRSPSP